MVCLDHIRRLLYLSLFCAPLVSKFTFILFFGQCLLSLCDVGVELKIDLFDQLRLIFKHDDLPDGRAPPLYGEAVCHTNHLIWHKSRSLYTSLGKRVLCKSKITTQKSLAHITVPHTEQ